MATGWRRRKAAGWIGHAAGHRTVSVRARHTSNAGGIANKRSQFSKKTLEKNQLYSTEFCPN